VRLHVRNRITRGAHILANKWRARFCLVVL
jgi:hypothetical protein